MGRQDDHDVLADLRQEIVEAVALFRVEAGGRLVDDDQLRVTQQGLGDPEALAHAAGIGGHGLLGVLGQVGLLQQGFDDLFAFLRIGQPLEDGEMVEHGPGRHPRIDAEILRQIAQRGAQRLGVLDDIEISPKAADPLSGACSVARVRISVDLPAPLGPSKPNMPLGMSSVTPSMARTPLP